MPWVYCSPLELSTGILLYYPSPQQGSDIERLYLSKNFLVFLSLRLPSLFAPLPSSHLFLTVWAYCMQGMLSCVPCSSWSSDQQAGLGLCFVILYFLSPWVAVHNFSPFPSFRLSPAAYYAQRMIQYLSRRDSIRQRSMRYQQNRLRSSSSSASSSETQGSSVEGNDLEFEEFE